ncbi:hypothetical protein [Fuerstiella marisgermanici]|uniref:Uncharacterized protein n=1 Tax=Fuerstiella marisgermanici TaxID=1891926 RepID=A0A1P8WGT8_9PLAN|nr:hypothetical protein [Fuerstiella marisgermanici]APZ93291.1 hypothetical protein Fuma_02908 [Fuerstiella marisgermanici]
MMKRFDFAGRWRGQIVPHLNDQEVAFTLTWGMQLLRPDYEDGNPPWHCGRGLPNGRSPREGCLSWYQPVGRCHHIAPFCWAIGRKIYPQLNWGFVSGEHHTVVIGYKADWQEPEWLMDILLFREKTAIESLAFVKSREWKFYPTIVDYAASFCPDSELVAKYLSGEMSVSEIASMSA